MTTSHDRWQKKSKAVRRQVRKFASYLAALPLIMLFKIIGPPRVLRYGCTLNKILLRAFGASVGKVNVCIRGPVVMHNYWQTNSYRNLTIADHCLMNGNILVDLCAPLILEEGVSLGPGVTIMTHNSYNRNAFLIDTLRHTCGEKPVLIKRGAAIKAHVLIVHGITIGENAVVAGGAVVNRDIPDNCFAAGVPAKVLKIFDNPPAEYIRTDAPVKTPLAGKV